jgi:hypothetical protein
LGVLNLPERPKFSATAVENGKTVEDPTMEMVSRAMAWTEKEVVRTTAAATNDLRIINLWSV